MVQQQTLANYVKPVPDKAGHDHLRGGFFAAVRLDDFSAGSMRASLIARLEALDNQKELALASETED